MKTTLQTVKSFRFIYIYIYMIDMTSLCKCDSRCIQVNIKHKSLVYDDVCNFRRALCEGKDPNIYL